MIMKLVRTVDWGLWPASSDFMRKSRQQGKWIYWQSPLRKALVNDAQMENMERHVDDWIASFLEQNSRFPKVGSTKHQFPKMLPWKRFPGQKNLGDVPHYTWYPLLWELQWIVCPLKALRSPAIMKTISLQKKLRLLAMDLFFYLKSHVGNTNTHHDTQMTVLSHAVNQSTWLLFLKPSAAPYCAQNQFQGHLAPASFLSFILYHACFLAFSQTSHDLFWLKTLTPMVLPA